MCLTSDALIAMGNLVGSPPIIINETALTLEHVMQRLEAIETKMPTIEHLANLDKRSIIILLNLVLRWELL